MKLPESIQIEPVGQCNLRCRMCPIQFRQDGPPYGPPAFMAFEDFLSLLDGFVGAKTLHLQGLGEPMMHPRFFDMVEAATGRGLEVTTNSNMTMLNADTARRCVTAGLKTLFASVDGATAATYEAIRTGAKFSRVKDNLQLMARTRRDLASATPRIELVMVLMKKNLPELPALVRCAKGWGADAMSVQHLCHDFGEESLPPQYRPMRDFVADEMLTSEDDAGASAIFASARLEAARLELPLRLPNLTRKIYPANTPGRSRCDWPWRSAYVSYDGLAMPCCMVATPDRKNFGNMVRDGVPDVWSNAAYQSFRSQLDSDSPPDICRSCSLYRGTF